MNKELILYVLEICKDELWKATHDEVTIPVDDETKRMFPGITGTPPTKDWTIMSASTLINMAIESLTSDK